MAPIQTTVVQKCKKGRLQCSGECNVITGNTIEFCAYMSTIYSKLNKQRKTHAYTKQTTLLSIPGDEGHGETLGTEAASSADSVQVLVTLVGEVVVDHDVHALNVDT